MTYPGSIIRLDTQTGVPDELNFYNGQTRNGQEYRERILERGPKASTQK
jgi:hypothetical protein